MASQTKIEQVLEDFRTARDKKGFTIEKVYLDLVQNYKLKVSHSTISAWSRGERHPHGDNLLTLIEWIKANQ